MIVKKIPLNSSELPILIEHSFPRLNPQDLLLGLLENKNKLRNILTSIDNQPLISSTTELEKNVIEALEKSTHNIDDDEKSEKSDRSEKSDTSEKSEKSEKSERSERSERNDEIIKEHHNEEEEESYYEDEEEHRDTQSQLMEEKSDILWSLKKLKRYYTGKSFPHYDEFTSINDLKRILKEVKREAILDENVNQTRQYITMVWFALEKVCTEYLSIDLSGFTAYETQHMNEYQKVLVEIGERSYLNWSEGFPPELKLVYLMLTHAALFHVKKNTTNFVDFINILDTKQNQGEMRGPSRIFS